jgi:cobalt-zinc-cadmium efflux system outer membrane protein
MRKIHAATVLMGLVLVQQRTARAMDDAPIESELAGEARLDTILSLALARNPDVLESRERVQAAEARAGGAAALPDAELKYEQWGVPLRRPVALNQADTLMLGLRQSFPAPGTRSARQRMAEEEAGGVRESGRARERELAAQVRRAYAQYWRAEQEYRIHLEHVGLLSQIVELSRGHYQSGHGSQQDLLRLTVELSQLHTDVANLEQERRSNRALLNALMGRGPDAPLGPAPDGALTMDVPEARAPRADASASRPEIAAAARAVRRSEAAVDLARSAAHWPSVMVGADYWYMPMLSTQHGYGAMVSINLPWLNPRHRAEVQEAEHTLAADRRALAAQRNVAGYEARDATARMEAARQGVRILDADLLPQARRSYESTEAAYASGQGSALALLDSLRAYLQVRLERCRALARLESSRADGDRALGVQAAGAGAEGRP